MPGGSSPCSSVSHGSAMSLLDDSQRRRMSTEVERAWSCRRCRRGERQRTIRRPAADSWAVGFGWDYVVATMRQYRPDAYPDFVADAVRPVADLVADSVL